MTVVGNFAVRLSLVYGLGILSAYAQAPESQRLVTACGVRLRAEAEVKAKEVGRLVLGDEVQVLAQSEAYATADGKVEPWLRVRLADGREGWVFGAFTLPLDREHPEAQAWKLLQERKGYREAPAANWAEALNYIERLQARFGGQKLAVELELARLEFAAGFLAAKGGSSKAPEHPALQSLKAHLIYHEPGGQWILKPRLYWDLYERNKALPFADEIAYAASRAILPGETEGYLPAVLEVVRATDGRYLELRPKGAYVGPVLANLSAYLGQFKPDAKGKSIASWEAGDVPALKAELAALAALVRKTEHPDAKGVLDLLEEIKRGLK